MWYVYRSTSTNLYLIGTFDTNAEALEFAKQTSLDFSDRIAVINANNVCVGKYDNGRYSI